jgi:poly-gamma-glutamate synthesis protein (capsule biosynthesis protein)
MGTVTLAAVGDIMLGDHPVCFGHGIRAKIRKGEPLIDPKLAALFADTDIVFGNLECILSEIGHDQKRLSSSEMRGEQSALANLQAAGFNTLCVANNHMLQHGAPAYLDTIAWLQQNAIAPVGLYEEGLSNVQTFANGDSKVAMVGYSFRPEHFSKDNRYYASPSQQAVLEQIAALRLSHADHALVVTLHWGEEYLHEPSHTQVEFAHRLIDAGVAVIIGHHPHVLQGVEKYRSGLIAYSLGNFIFDSWQSPTRESAVLKCTFSGNELLDYTVTPIKIDRNFYVRLPDNKEAQQLAKKLQNYSHAIAAKQGLVALDQSQYDKLAEKTYLRYRLECYWYFLLHLWKYQPSVVGYSFYRAFLRRLGLG